MSEIDEKSRELIKTRIISKMQDIKSFPQFVMETMRKLNDPDSNAADVAKSLSRDEGLVLRILKLANSAAYGQSRSISNISEAIALLGYKSVSNIILAATVYSAMDKGLTGYALDRGELWRHSLMVAYTSRYLAKLTGKVSTEDAYVGGLLHDIGKVILNDYVRFGYGIIVKIVEEKHIPFTEAEWQVLGFDHAEIGEILVSRWEMPESYRVAVAYHHKPNELPEDKLQYQPLLDVVTVANTICLMLGIGLGADGLQAYIFPEPLERLGITNFESLFSEMIDFAGKVASDMGDMAGL
ncbi:MAG: HDOD domain-containing protein [Synergistaceae bacterium]|nr:HDOD domain-containing protein [Synergistaceae bacterium]MBQ6434523.1 HDOD domain-containing protein [Synergistaceae bacterium]MBQ6738741.1 HDOD domain-containing protein [Synergistaceae bacterium]MBQ7068305.1 HDOD domain-containing protein [Synergistaceae bacterium]MBR0074941.1 HDOD domain-containing protein [Synergistaceae bacterium]